MYNPLAPPLNAGKSPPSPERLITLDISLLGDRVKIGAFEAAGNEAATMRSYEEMRAPMETISLRCRQVVETLNRSGRTGRLTPELLDKLKGVGQMLRDELFSRGIKEKLDDTKAHHLILNLDDQLVHIPWELFHDGLTFLGLRFCVGRVVKTGQKVPASRQRPISPPFKMLIVADPGKDLSAAYQEGIRVRDLLECERGRVDVSFRSDGISGEWVREKIRNFDFFHFAGHAEYNSDSPEESCLRLGRESISAGEIMKMAGTGCLPALVFLNACQSARSSEKGADIYLNKGLFGLADSFLLAGVSHYIGTYWELLDVPGQKFALSFYRYLMDGLTIGTAVREARMDVIKAFGEETIVWGSYLLYGDPTARYADPSGAFKDCESPKPEVLGTKSTSGHSIRAKEEIIRFDSAESRRKRGRTIKLAVLSMVLLAGLFWAYFSYSSRQLETAEKAAIQLFNNGSLNEAKAHCLKALEKNSDRLLPRLILGNISFLNGETDTARGHYEKIRDSAVVPTVVKANALIGLGRIASLGQDPDTALSYYREAAAMIPDDNRPLLFQASLLENSGKYEAALALLDTGIKPGQGEATLSALRASVYEKLAAQKAVTKTDRVDSLIEELERKKSESSQTPLDPWTSRPISVWITTIATSGYSLMESKGRLLESLILQQFSNYPRMVPVERTLLDGVLSELKIGTGQLADPGNALTLGRLVAARVIIAGEMTCLPDSTQVILRAVDSETGEICGVINETFEREALMKEMGEKIAGELMRLFHARFPLQAKIVEVKGDELLLNIGSRQGAQIGQRFGDVESWRMLCEIISSQPDQSIAKILRNDQMNIKDLRVKILSE